MSAESPHPQETKRVYLGDSVYAEIEDGMLKLTTRNGYPDDPRNVIFLEAEVLCALLDYLDTLGIGR